MADYSSEIDITWGSQGQQPPSGYSYEEGEQPVDEWDNFVNFQLMDDVLNHLIPLTNRRIESYKNLNDVPSGENEPDSGTLIYEGNVHESEFQAIGVYSEFNNDHHRLMYSDGHGWMTGDLGMNGNNILAGRSIQPIREVDPTHILKDGDGVTRDVYVINGGDPIPSEAGDDDIIFERE